MKVNTKVTDNARRIAELEAENKDLHARYTKAQDNYMVAISRSHELEKKLMMAQERDQRLMTIIDRLSFLAER